MSFSILLILLCIGWNPLFGQTEAKIIEEFEALEAKQKDSVYVEMWGKIQLFTKVTEPFYQLAGAEQGIADLNVPEHIFKIDPEFFRFADGKKDWLQYSFSLVNDLNLYKSARVPTIGGLVFMTYKLNDASSSIAKAMDKDAPILESNSLFEPLINAILALNFQQLIDNTAIYSKEVRENLAKYETKYQPGYRNRNILDYFLSGGIRGIKERKKRKNGKNDNSGNLTFLEPPGRIEPIFLANPILSLGSPSFSKFKDDPSSLYLLMQIIGVDYFSADYSKFFGGSIIHASPVNTDFEFFTRPYLGLELHYKNTINFGMGWEYSSIGAESTEDYGFKLFLSVAFFDRLFKKKESSQ